MSGSRARKGKAAPRQRVLVTGATSQVGAFLLPMLEKRGYAVTALSRRPPPADSGPGIAWLQGDIKVPSALEGVAGRADVLIHLAPLPVLPPLVGAAAERGVRRIVAFGSTSRFTKVGSSDAGEARLAAALEAAEAAFAGACEGHGIAWTLFRPTLIYGGPGSAVAFMARHIRAWGLFPIAGQGSGLRQPVHAEDLAAACLRVLDRNACFGRAYNLGGGEVLSYREMVERVFHQEGRRPRLVSLPLPLLKAGIALARLAPPFRELTPAMAERVNRDQNFETADAQRDFGYTARGFLAAPERAGGHAGEGRP